MTDKCKKKMSGGVEYITREISQRMEEAQKGVGGGEASGVREELGILILGRGLPSPWDL